jgi:adenosylcobinamide-GDP ribazoletransferase
MRALARSLALFTVAPIRGYGELTRSDAVAALRWLPLLGAALGALAALPLAATLQWASHAALLGAVLAVAALALVTRGLHLDGLADTVDGLGSRASADRALEIMRRSDVGPFGVVAIVLVVFVDIAALAALGGGVWRPVAALAVAAATGRLAVLFAAHRRVPSARSVGFGAYVAGSVSTFALIAETVAVLGLGVGMAALVDASLIGWPLAQAAALVLAGGFRMHATRRLGGVTGDVFGALVEIGTALALAGLALS